MIIISMSGTHLSSRGITLHEEGKTKNEVLTVLSDWMLTQYLGAGGLYRYCFVCLTSLTTGLVQVVSGSPTCVIHQASEVHPEVNLKAE